MRGQKRRRGGLHRLQRPGLISTPGAKPLLTTNWYPRRITGKWTIISTWNLSSHTYYLVIIASIIKVWFQLTNLIFKFCRNLWRMRQPITTWHRSSHQPGLGEVQQVASSGHTFRHLSSHPPQTLSLLTKHSRPGALSTIETGVEVEDAPWQTIRLQKVSWLIICL